MHPLWTTTEIAAATGGDLVGRRREEITAVSIDSRTCGEGDAFFAIKGDRHDGHDFIADVQRRNVALAVVSREKFPSLPKNGPLLVVPDVLDALIRLGRSARLRSRAKIIAVTGSVGKTGTKEALLHVLAKQGETHASVASFNNHWGVPLTLARLSKSARFGIFEIGMNHAGEFTPLSRLVQPHISIITTVEPVHLEYFKSVEGIADAKAEIFAGMEKDSVAILPGDNPHFERMAKAAQKRGLKIVRFGSEQTDDAALLGAALKPDVSTVHASILGEELTYKLGMPGKHIVMNSLAVLAAAKLAGADLALAALALNELVPPPGRGRRFTLTIGNGLALLIDESYNANPASMRAALEVLGAASVGGGGRRIAVLGDMRELGEDAAGLHRELAEAVSRSGVDLVYCAGPLMQELWNALPSPQRGGYAETAEALGSQLVSALQPGDAVMVKGSNASRMGPLAKSLIERFREPAAGPTA